MKRTLPILLCLALLFAEYSARAPEPPRQDFVACVLTWCCIGVLVLCVGACYYNALHPKDYSGPTNAPPIIPYEPPDTNAVPTNLPPNITGLTLDATGETERLDMSSSNWLDSAGFPVSSIYRTTIQTASSLGGPWTNGYVVTLWESAYGDTMLVEDGVGNGLSTNYTPKAANGSVTNRSPLELNMSDPVRFYRAKP